MIAWDDTQEGVIVDPGCFNQNEFDAITSFIESENIKPVKILLTHGHFDHIYGVRAYVEMYGIPVYMSDADKFSLENSAKYAEKFGLPAPEADFETTNISEGDTVSFGETSFSVIETPGHTPGGVCFYCEKEKVLFSGDTLFAGSIGRTDGPGGDYDKLIVGIMDKIMGLDGDVDVLPGHGHSTTIADERTSNPFLQPFNEPEQEGIDWNADGIELLGEDL